MDTFKIIKELTAKTDMLSGQPIKDNFKALLPIVAVSKGWGLYGGLVEFNFKPHEDYPHKEPYTKKSDANDNHHRITVVDEINKDIDGYNEWVDDQNEQYKDELSEKIPEANWEKGIETNVHDVKDLKLKNKRYFRLSPHKAWLSAFQFDAPQFRPFTHLIEFGFVDDEELYKQKEKMKEKIFVKRFNVHLFNYIQESIKWAKENEAWEHDNLWFQPNKEFAQWFQLRGINPEEVPSFDNAIIDLSYDEECEEAFDVKDWNCSLVKIEQEMRDVITMNEHLFKVSGKLQFKKGYEIGCRYWTHEGQPITVKQMVNASTRYPK